MQRKAASGMRCRAVPRSIHSVDDPCSRGKTCSSWLGNTYRALARPLTVPAEMNELTSAGTLGLISAVNGFDPSRGLAFSTYAAPRIPGAILDELRSQDIVPVRISS
jgi:hypothetical protein